MVFSSLLVFFLAVKYFIRFLVPSEPEAAIILNKRHQYVVDRVVKVASGLSVGSGDIELAELYAGASEPED